MSEVVEGRERAAGLGMRRLSRSVSAKWPPSMWGCRFRVEIMVVEAAGSGEGVVGEKEGVRGGMEGSIVEDIVRFGVFSWGGGGCVGWCLCPFVIAWKSCWGEWRREVGMLERFRRGTYQSNGQIDLRELVRALTPFMGTGSLRKSCTR